MIVLDRPRLEKLGIAIEHAADGSVDVEGTILNVIDRLHDINDPAERAGLAVELLGKRWQYVADLIAGFPARRRRRSRPLPG